MSFSCSSYRSDLVTSLQSVVDSEVQFSTKDWMIWQGRNTFWSLESLYTLWCSLSHYCVLYSCYLVLLLTSPSHLRPTSHHPHQSTSPLQWLIQHINCLCSPLHLHLWGALQPLQLLRCCCDLLCIIEATIVLIPWDSVHNQTLASQHLHHSVDTLQVSEFVWWQCFAVLSITSGINWRWTGI